MLARIAKLSSKDRMLLALPILALAYPVVMVLLPDLLRALVPNVVRSVLSLI
jgi:hypothetical protein